MQIARDVLPPLTASGAKLVAIGIGTVERGNEFAAHVAFPLANLYCDPDNTAYSALGLKFGLTDTLFNPQTPLAIAKRFAVSATGGDSTTLGGASDLTAALGRWKPWIPPKLEQGLQQGGTFVFLGSQEVFSYYDPSTGAHADLNEVLKYALEAANAAAALKEA